MEQLLNQTALSNEASGRAAGLITGHAEGMAAERDLQDARDSTPRGSA
jgi:hypothetical protein